MPARDAANGQSPSGSDAKERASAGGARFFRGNGRFLLIGVALALVAVAAWRGSGGGGSDAGDRGRSGAPSGSAGSAVTTAPGGTGPSGSDTATTGTTLTPPDVPHARTPVDLRTPPPAADPDEVARWWASAYVAYIGAEPPTKLADRLAPLTAPAFLAQLRALAPAASYDPPLTVAGASAEPVPGAAGGAGGAGTRKVRVTVETDADVVLYDVTVSQAQGGWRVDQATRI
jgi:hypothetical protein